MARRLVGKNAAKPTYSFVNVGTPILKTITQEIFEFTEGLFFAQVDVVIHCASNIRTVDAI